MEKRFITVEPERFAQAYARHAAEFEALFPEYLSWSKRLDVNPEFGNPHREAEAGELMSEFQSAITKKKRARIWLTERQFAQMLRWERGAIVADMKEKIGGSQERAAQELASYGRR